MSLTGILDLLAADRAVNDVLRIAREGGEPLLDLTGPPGLRAPLVAALAGDAPAGAARPVLAVTATGREAEDLAAALRCFLPEHTVAEFGAWETLPHERLSPRSDTVGRRIAVLRRLAHPETDEHGPVRVVVAPVRAVLQPVVAGLGDLEPVALHQGQEAELTDVVERLAAAAYSRTDLVERRGEFAVRGGILDVFPPTEEHPLRVEFWGDEVEEIRYFAVADQRSLQVAESGLWAPPCRELLLTDSVKLKAADLAERLPGVADLLGKVAAGVAVEGMESLTPVLVDAMESVLDVLPEGTHVVLADPERIRARAHDLVATSEEFLQASWLSAAAGSAVPVDLEPVLGTGSFWTLADVRAHALKQGLPWWTISPFGLDETGQAAHDEGDEGAVVLVPEINAPEPYRGDRERAIADIGRWLHDGWRVAVITEGGGLARRVVEMLTEADLAAVTVESLDEPPAPSVAAVGTGRLGQGFIAPAQQFAVLTETDLTGGSAPGTTTKDMRRMPARRKNVVDPMQLTTGDNVVHEQHGVGKFVELVQRTVGGATREYLVIEYAPSKRGQPGDRLFVPTDALDQVTRYVGGEQPTLNKLGGTDWAKTKGRARKAVKQIAGELIQLYSARMATSGHAFGPDTPWQRELEDAFAYVETPDQLVTIDEVKQDMEKTVPMDRLICGDVGYGKTEIAVRAAFKAVQDGKQVAVLVPTTLLVQQHLDTFVERYVNFPVNVKGLSRFSSEAEARAVKEGITDGSVDVVIGTHRLLTGEITFKDLGLVVIDEEQRFGVEHKERLKQLRTNVDVLAMSATPIPRTLELAVTGIREMSTLATPPEERHPVLTFVGGYDERQISAAIRRELLREGQVFFIHNRVESIDRTAARLHELVPEARIATAHGKMGEHQLEQVMVDFWEKRFDVLVCTTIIETGLDISNANTLILERADMMGLSQLHQLRGRVGRGRERAYAYFLYPSEKPLTETALDRLQTIAANTDLGAGMRVAMKDLEIRGAGNLLGGEQSGHIAGVGFDLYIRLVGEAVAEFRGENEQEHQEVKIDLPVDAHLPTAYLPDERLRLEAYRKLAEVSSDEALDAVKAELVDRYGPLPDVVTNLLEVARLRILARQAGLSEITTMGKAIRFGPIDLPDSARMRLHRLYPGTQDKPATKTVLVPGPTTARIGGRPLRDVAVLTWAREFIESVLLNSVRAAATVGTKR
ncbi:transcription-repair coupling factor [Kineosporia succinea]|uniref:Transcription-repair-coupling factor n=1 Tax=Kineosporia succinea TaxID=84632 RepID=A0ABT9NZM0_9ACTN|nr:transcription-repair coupling factor [Kineosporia succinea]MDP9825599.1 transcription-repair coupling factor (superfamily II helicase) [Kineosporia succinea]